MLQHEHPGTDPVAEAHIDAIYKLRLVPQSSRCFVLGTEAVDSPRFCIRDL